MGEEQQAESEPQSTSRGQKEGHAKGFFGRLARGFRGAPTSRRELVDELRTAQDRSLLDSEALTMIEGVLQVGDMQVRDIMIPRSQMVVLDRDAESQELLQTVVESGHSRFPVVSDNRDEIIGILLAKDLLGPLGEMLHSAEDANRAQVLPIRGLLRPAAFVPESKRLNVLLREFRTSRNHIAIVVDEYANVAGLVTIEDVLEQIVGEIDDEHDTDETAHNIHEHESGDYSVKALTPIEEFNECFGTTLPDDEFDTVGGLVMQSLGRLPRRDDELVLDGLAMKVLRADNRRVHLLQVGNVEAPEKAQK